MEILWISTEAKNHVYLSRDIAVRYSIKDKMEIHFGKWSQEVSVEIDDKLPLNTIAVSEFVLKPYNISTNLPYDIVIEENKIKIGPVIGIMVSFTRFFNHHEDIGRTTDYKQIKGLLFICRPKDIDMEKRTINGYYYNPSGETKETQWIEGTFPFPDVLYNRRKSISEELYSQLKQAEVEIFNSHNYNKWQQYELFSEDSNLKSFLPETMKLTKSSLTKMLENYNEIYVKPTSRADGSGIRVIKKNENGYSLIEKNSMSQLFNTKDSLYRAIKRKNYVLQQSVAYKTENRNLDFRVVLQKDVTKQWNRSFLLCRVSKENSIITNYYSRQSLLSGMDALTTIYHLSPEQAKEIENEVVQLCKSLVETIEKRGVHLGDVAFDLIIDSNLKLWILEIQIRYGAFAMDDLNSEEWCKTMVTPLYYAKALAGF